MIIITLGTFDLFHRGHVRLFKKCVELAGPDGAVTIGLNTDEFVLKYKGKAPVMNYQERADIIQEVMPDVSIMPNGQEENGAKDLIIRSRADLIVVGSDWARKDYVGQLGLDWDWLDEYDIGICYVNYTFGISTTELKRRIAGA